MSRSPVVACFLSAALATGFVQQAAAWGTGGAVKSPFKVFPNLTLFCDLDDPASTATIEAAPCGPSGCAAFMQGQSVPPNAFEFKGQLVCAEVPATVSNPSLANAVDIDGDNVPDIGVFELTQKEMKDGLEYDSTFVDSMETRTWIFRISQGPPTEKLIWELVPKSAADKQKFCADPNDTASCVALFGVENKPNANDFENGVVFSFSTKIPSPGATEIPLTLSWFPCHNGAFDSDEKISCKVRQLATKSEGEVEALLEVEFQFSPTLNVGNKSGPSTMKLVICGNQEVIFDDESGAPVDTTQPIRVNGHTVSYSSFFVNESNSGVCAGGGPDLNLQVNRKQVIAAVTPCSGPEDPVKISGNLTQGGKFGGIGTISVKNCE